MTLYILYILFTSHAFEHTQYFQGHSNNSYCASSHWKAARNTANRQTKLDETGLLLLCIKVNCMATHIICRSTASFTIMLSSYAKMLFVNTSPGLLPFEKICHLTEPFQWHQPFLKCIVKLMFGHVRYCTEI